VVAGSRTTPIKRAQTSFSTTSNGVPGSFM
jgi:hypothetical protein